MSKFKISVAAIFVALVFVGGILGNTADAAATKVFRNSESNFAVTIPSDWETQKSNEVDIFSSPDRKLVVVALCQAIPRADSYGKYLLDEANAAEKATMMETMSKGFLENASAGMSLTESKYIKLSSGHSAIFIKIEGASKAPMLGVVIIRDKDVVMLVSSTESDAEFKKQSKNLVVILNSLQAE